MEVRAVARWRVWLTVVVALWAAGATAFLLLRKDAFPGPDGPRIMSRQEQTRQVLFEELLPVKLANCEVERFGEPNDGGYLMCGNLLGSAAAGYSYGIGGYDGWGCDISRRLDVRVHQSDCFNTAQPACPGGDTVFHEECVSGEPGVDGGRLFDTVQNQIAKNGDNTRQFVMKIDVEGAEWDTFLGTPDSVLEQIDQITVEFHGVQEDRFIAVVRQLKKFFHVADLHFNNWSCSDGLEPFPAWAYEVLFVSKRLGVLDPSETAGSFDDLVRFVGTRLGLVDPPDTAGGFHLFYAPNNPHVGDCQAPVS